MKVGFRRILAHEERGIGLAVDDDVDTIRLLVDLDLGYSRRDNGKGEQWKKKPHESIISTVGDW